MNCITTTRTAASFVVRPGALTYNQMVVDQAPAAPEAADRSFRALADATRRDILARTLAEPQSVSALARRYPMSFAAVQKHVAVLEGAGLVTKRRSGREQLVTGDVTAVRRTARMLDELEAVWRARMDRFGTALDDEEGDAPWA
jgi:DNA-binding transcriptional ArsR family regulator